MALKRNKIPWNKGNRKYTITCPTCKVIIKTFSNEKKFCNRKCYFSSNQFKKMASKNGKGLKGIKRKEYRVSWGYNYLFLPYHPDSNSQGYLAEHRLMAERKLGRRLTKDEIVHHINHNKKDNTEGNLEVMSRVEHGKIHNSIKTWSRKFLSCVKCNTTKRKHASNGLCVNCYGLKNIKSIMSNFSLNQPL